MQPDSDSNAWFHNRKSARYRIQLKLSKLTGGRIRSPFYVAWLKLRRDKDDQARRDSQLEANQRADYWYATSVEFYSASSIGRLERGLGSLKEARGRANEERIDDTIRNFRDSVGSSMEVYLEKPDSDSFTTLGHLAKLPQMASSARATIMNLTPSLTAMVVTFRIKSDERELLNDDLHRTYPVFLETLKKGGIRTHDSKSQHRNIVRDFQLRLNAEISEWFFNLCPGYFTASSQDRPICFNLSTGSAKPFRHEARAYSILDPLDLNYAPYVFRSQKIPANIRSDGIYFAPNVFRRNGNFSFIAGSKAAFQRLRSEGWGTDCEGPSRYIDDLFRRSLGVWWTLDLLKAFRSDAALVRDHTKAALGANFIRPSLRNLQLESLRLADNAAIARELSEYSERSLRFSFEADAYLVDARGGRDQKSMKDIYIEAVKEEAELVCAELRDLNETLFSQSNLISAAYSIRVQNIVLFVAVASLIIAALTWWNQGR